MSLRTRTLSAVETLWRDLRYAIRALAKAPSFSAVALLSLALGIGANAAIFSVIDAVLLRALPVKAPEELVEFVRAAPDGAMMTNFPKSFFEHLRVNHGPLSDVFAVRDSRDVLRTNSRSVEVGTNEVSGSFFQTLGVQPFIGRAITPEDDKPEGGADAAVISYAFWSREFGRSPSALGADLRLSDRHFTVVGIMPPEFFGINRGSAPDLWIPLAIDDPSQVWVMGRLRPGTSIERTRAEIEPVFRQALESHREQLKKSSERERNAFFAQRLLVNHAITGTSGVRWAFWEYQYTLKILLCLAGLVLLIACLNLANLLMARSASRSREIGIRLAMGAGRQQLIRQLMMESVLLSMAGGTLGLIAAAWGHRLLLSLLVRDPQTVALDFHLNHRLLGFGFALSLVTGLLFGVMPAIRATRAELSTSIHKLGPQAGTWSRPLAKGLLMLQIGVALVLLIGAGLFARSLRNLKTTDLGVASENLLLMDVRLAEKSVVPTQRFWMQLPTQVSGLPGVQNVALAGDAVFGNGGWNQTLWIGRPGQPSRDVRVSDNSVTPGFFATVGIPLLKGREFNERDREGSPWVAVVNQAFARRFFGNEDPIGKHFGNRGESSTGMYEIVGVVGDAKYGAVREQPRPMVFYSMWQDPPRSSYVMHVRTISEPQTLAAAVRREIEATGRDVLISDVRTLPQVIQAQLLQDRMLATLASFFAILALALGAIGIYGILAYRVSQRTVEIGVRLAVGAQKGDVLWLVMRETFVLLLAGAAIGLPSALLAARLVKTQLFALVPSDPVTIAVSSVVLFAAGALAGYIPARRAASVEPMWALRSE